MDFSTKFTVRTDLADEAIDKTKLKKGQIGDGIYFETINADGVFVDKLEVSGQNGEKTCGKPVGEYYTISTGEVWQSDKDTFESLAKAIGLVLKKLLSNAELVLVVCLGNIKITADAIGPLTAKNIIVTRHMKLKERELFDSMGLGNVSCFVPGVMGDTGAESAELILGAVSILKPDAVIVVDALASSTLSRLARTVQITDTGICPGSGVGNNRCEISKKTLGIPTVAVGVPTVVDTGSLFAEMLSELASDNANFDFTHRINEIEKSFVCPKETDKIVSCVSKLVGYGINFALHKDMTMNEMDEFLS